MTDEYKSDRDFYLFAAQRAEILHAASAWGFCSDGAIIQRLLSERTALIAAGDKLAGFATCDDDECFSGHGKPCTCGYTEAWKAWKEAAGVMGEVLDKIEHKDSIAALEAENARLREGLREMFEAVCGETGFAQAVRADSGFAYPWPALDLAEAKARAALGDTQ